MLLYLAAQFAFACFGLAMLFSGLRLVRGPAAQDRILALDTLYICAMLAVLTQGILRGDGNTLYFDVALLIALLGFLGSAAMAKFLLRGEVIEP